MFFLTLIRFNDIIILRLRLLSWCFRLQCGIIISCRTAALIKL